jgi:hypothetical protein
MPKEGFISISQRDLGGDAKQCHIQGLSGPSTEMPFHLQALFKMLKVTTRHTKPSKVLVALNSLPTDRGVPTAFCVSSSSFQIKPHDVRSSLGGSGEILTFKPVSMAPTSLMKG